MLLWPVAIGTGTACVAAQGLLTLLFAKWLPDGIYRREPAFLAHQIVAFPVMCLVAYIGTVAWFFPDEESQQMASTVVR